MGLIKAHNIENNFQIGKFLKWWFPFSRPYIYIPECYLNHQQTTILCFCTHKLNNKSLLKVQIIFTTHSFLRLIVVRSAYNVTKLMFVDPLALFTFGWPFLKDEVELKWNLRRWMWRRINNWNDKSRVETHAKPKNKKTLRYVISMEWILYLMLTKWNKHCNNQQENGTQYVRILWEYVCV